MEKALPNFLKRYFWDVNFSKLERKKHAYFIIKRILENGDEEAVNWMFNNFKKPKIIKVLTKSKSISPLSANYWSLILGVPKKKILCLKKQFQKKPRKIWPY